MARRILVIEDEQDIRDSLTEAIESEGYTAISAPNGRDAISMYDGNVPKEAELPDLILLDHLMPHLNGAGFLEHARKSHRLAKIPIILMTADSKAAQKATKYGADGHLHKPLELDELFSTIEKHCQH